MSTPAWLQDDDEDDVYEFDREPSVGNGSMGSFQPTPPTYGSPQRVSPSTASLVGAPSPPREGVSPSHRFRPAPTSPSTTPTSTTPLVSTPPPTAKFTGSDSDAERDERNDKDDPLTNSQFDESNNRKAQAIDVDIKNPNEGKAVPAALLARLSKQPAPKPKKPTLTVVPKEKPKKTTRIVKREVDRTKGTFVTDDTPRSTAPIGVDGGISAETVDLSIIPPLSDSDETDMADLLAFFDRELVCRLRSSRHQHRSEVMSTLTEEMRRSNKQPNEVTVIANRVWSIGLGDKVIGVYLATLMSVSTLLPTLPSSPEYKDLTLALIGALVSKLKDSNNRCREAAVEHLQQLAELPKIGFPMVVDGLLEGSESESNWKSIQARVAIVTIALDAESALYSTKKQGLVDLAVVGLSSSHAKTRQLSVAFAAKILSVIGHSEMSLFADVSSATMRSVQEALTGCEMGTENTQLEEDEDLASLQEDPPLGENVTEVAEKWNKLFGLRTGQCLYASRWKLRDRLLDRVHRVLATELKPVPGHKTQIHATDDGVIEALSQINEKSLADSVPSVLTTAYQLLQTSVQFLEAKAPIKQYATFANRVLPAMIRQYCISGADVLPTIVEDFAANVLSPAAVFDAIRDLGTLTVAKTSAKLMIGRLKLTSAVVEKCGFERSTNSKQRDLTPMSLEDVMKFTVAALEHSQSKVRATAAGTVGSVYKRSGNDVQPYLAKLRGTVLEDLKSKISTITKKERTSTAPLKRLAGIIEPLVTSPCRPSTEQSGTAFTRDSSVRERVTRVNRRGWQPPGAVRSGLGKAAGESSDSDGEDALDAPVLRKEESLSGPTAVASGGVIRPGAARKNRLVFS